MRCPQCGALDWRREQPHRPTPVPDEPKTKPSIFIKLTGRDDGALVWLRAGAIVRVAAAYPHGTHVHMSKASLVAETPEQVLEMIAEAER